MREIPPAGWLENRLTTGDLPWDQAVQCTIMRFLEEYSFHDSSWVGLWMPLLRTHSIVVITLDTVWSKPRISGEASILIRLSSIPILISTPVNQEGIGPTLAGAASRPLTAKEGEQLLSLSLGASFLDDSERQGVVESPLHKTTFDTIMSERVTLIHPPNVDILCMNHEGNPMPIPGFSTGHES